MFISKRFISLASSSINFKLAKWMENVSKNSEVVSDKIINGLQDNFVVTKQIF